MAEIKGWTGCVITVPRTKIAELLNQEEVKGIGIYFLLGVDEQGTDSIYVGESTSVGERLKRHSKDSKKYFWEETCVVINRGTHLTNTHAKYLEAKLITIIRKANNLNLVNKNKSSEIELSGSDKSFTEDFINKLQMLLPVLGLNFLREVPNITPSKSENVSRVVASKSPTFELTIKGSNILALAHQINGEFIVKKDSRSRKKWSGEPSSYSVLFHNYIKSGKIVRSSNKNEAVFQEDIAFDSPSAAAAVVLGRQSNGRKEWKVQGSPRVTYNQWQNKGIDENTKNEAKESGSARLLPLSAESSPIFEIKMKNINLLATAKQIGDKIVVQKESECKLESSEAKGKREPSIHREKFDEYVRTGKIIKSPDGVKGILQEDVAFDKPSAAAVFVIGWLGANGRDCWKIKGTKVTYGEWEDSQDDKSS